MQERLEEMLSVLFGDYFMKGIWWEYYFLSIVSLDCSFRSSCIKSRKVSFLLKENITISLWHRLSKFHTHQYSGLQNHLIDY